MNQTGFRQTTESLSIGFGKKKKWILQFAANLSEVQTKSNAKQDSEKRRTYRTL
jgi:hypothetical protein